MGFRVSIEAEGETLQQFDVAKQPINHNKLQTLVIGNLSQGKKVEVKVEVDDESYAGGVVRKIGDGLADKLRGLGFGSKVQIMDSRNEEDSSNKSVIKLTP